jgi:hypothetical protein
MLSTPDTGVSLSGTITERKALQLSYNCTLDAAGHGAFDKVLPGVYAVFRNVSQTSSSLTAFRWGK